MADGYFSIIDLGIPLESRARRIGFSYGLLARCEQPNISMNQIGGFFFTFFALKSFLLASLKKLLTAKFAKKEGPPRPQRFRINH
jgi:hypothetical protein